MHHVADVFCRRVHKNRMMKAGIELLSGKRVESKVLVTRFLGKVKNAKFANSKGIWSRLVQWLERRNKQKTKS